MRSRALAAALAAVLLLSSAGSGGVECPAIDRIPPPGLCPEIDAVAREAPRLRVFLDRRTGRVRPPTPEEARALFEEGGARLEHLVPLEVVVHPGGMRSVDLKGAFSHRLEVRRQSDGTLTGACRSSGAVPEEK